MESLSDSDCAFEFNPKKELKTMTDIVFIKEIESGVFIIRI